MITLNLNSKMTHKEDVTQKTLEVGVLHDAEVYRALLAHRLEGGGGSIDEPCCDLRVRFEQLIIFISLENSH